MDKYQQADHDWLQCMIRIGQRELFSFENDSVMWTEQIVCLDCLRSIMVWVYSTLKKHRLIEPIESLDKETKNKMWGFVNEVCAGKLEDKQKKIEVAKTFYVIEYFINESKQ